MIDLFKWTEREPLPLPRAGCAAGVVQGRVVVAGGTLWQGDKKVWVDRVDRFDPRLNRWEACAPMPRPHGDAACAVLGDDLYVFGGGADGSCEAGVCRLRSGAWALLEDCALPSPRKQPAVAVLDGTVYLVGGYTTGELTSATATLWSWRPGGRWEPRAPRPGILRFTPAVAAVGDRILVAGGATSEDGSVRNLDDILAYDPGADSWSEIGRLPQPIRAACGLAQGGRMLFIGGYTDAFEKPILSIDPISGAVSPAGALPHGLADTRFVGVGASVIGVTGESGIKQRAPWTLQAG